MVQVLLTQNWTSKKPGLSFLFKRLQLLLGSRRKMFLDTYLDHWLLLAVD